MVILENIGGKPEVYVCVCACARSAEDPEEQALAPRFLSTAANISCTEGDQGCSTPSFTYKSYTDDIIQMSLYEQPGRVNSFILGE